MRAPRPRALASLALLIALGAVPAGAEGLPPGHDAATRDTDVDRLLARADAEEQRIVAQLDDARPRLDLVRRRMVARGRAYYRLRRAGLLPAGGGFDALVDHAARVERTRRALERDVTAEASLSKHIGEMEARLAQVRADKAPLAVQREALQRARQALQEIEERRAAFARAFETSVRPDAVAIYGADMGPAPDALSGFRDRRGRLPFPLAGRAEVNRVNRGGGPGVEFVASSGTPVRSVAAGRVAFADRADAYGLTIIVDHGDHYYSLYGSLGSSDVRAGETVSAGARLGTVGSVDGAAPRLYFELRHDASTLDPGPWLGL